MNPDPQLNPKPNANPTASAAATPTAATWIAFDGSRRIAAGTLQQVALIAKAAADRSDGLQLLVFDDRTSERIELDLRGSASDVLKRLAPTAPEAEPPLAAPGKEPGSARGPGRPKLGVVAREVTLLPRHWDWLNVQPGGASVALRKLVEEARRINGGKDRVRQAQESAYRFLSPMAGHLAGFEEATRALFAADATSFHTQVAAWPADVRAHASHLVAQLFEPHA